MPDVVLDPSGEIFKPNEFTGATAQQIHASVCGTQIEETYYLKNNEALFVANFFTKQDGNQLQHLLMVALEDPDEVMWKLVSK